jgi:peptidoglycan/xylan/chitin deacetylase (PgdA/CDA1 family)
MTARPYGPFPYSPIIERPRLRWPNDARVALWVIPNIEFFALDDSVPAGAGGTGIKPPDVPTWASRDYGNRVGVFRMMDTMDRYGIRGTVALNSDVCIHHPAIIEAGKARGWEWMGHNRTNTQRLNAVPAEEEAALIKSVVDTIAASTGVPPAGWLGSGLQETWNTVRYLAEAGLEYVADWVNDDQPYFIDAGPNKRLVSLPYSWYINDKPAFEHDNRTAAEFCDMICRQFDVLYREGAESGRVMAIALHPYLTGLPFRIGALEDALAYICRHEGVWRATGSEIVRHWVKNHGQ